MGIKLPPPGRDRTRFVLARSTPEVQVGGFTRRDTTLLLYSLIRSVLQPDFHVLDFGAGRGAESESPFPFKRDFVNLKGDVARIVGVDVDPAVLKNPMLDEAHVFVPGARLPFPDASFDVIFSDWVLEHVDDPALLAAEVERLLKPGGWFFARTPNKFGVIAIGASLIPNKAHVRVLKKLQPDRIAPDVFPTRYRMNTVSAIRRIFPSNIWENCSSTVDTEIPYLVQYPVLFHLFDRCSRLLPSPFRPVLLIALRKR